jgi:pantothenate kinase type III
MKSGAVFGAAAMLDGMAARMETELGYGVKVVATGGDGEGHRALLQAGGHIRRGPSPARLAIIYAKNKNRKRCKTGRAAF